MKQSRMHVAIKRDNRRLAREGKPYRVDAGGMTCVKCHMEYTKGHVCKPERIVRRFTADPEQGMAGMLAGSTAEGLPLKSMVRKGNNVTAVYER